MGPLQPSGNNKTYAAARSRYFWPSMKEDCQQLTQSCQICKELNPKTSINPNIDPVTPITSLQPFKSVGLDMFSWKNTNYLLIVDRMSGYILHRESILKVFFPSKWR